MRVYFDNAASSPMLPEVLDAMIPYLTGQYGNPSAIHSFGREARAAIEKSRKTIARFLNASTGEIFFTSGGTESNNMILSRSIDDLGVKTIITSPLEHHSVTHTIKAIEKAGKAQVKHVKIDAQGNIDLKDLESILAGTEGPKLVSLMHGNNEIGTMIQPDHVADLCGKHGALFHSDTVQTVAHFPFDLQKTRIDFLTGSAHKFHGPKGSGFVYIRNPERLHPLICGGSQERNMRAGTENISGIVGMAKAIEIAYEGLDHDRKKIRDLRDYMKSSLQSAIPGVRFNGNQDEMSLFTVLSVSFPPGDHSDLLLFNLDIEGVAASGGSACSSGSQTGSHVLAALDKNDTHSTIRFSFSKLNTREEVDYVVQHLKVLTGNVVRNSVGEPVQK